MPVSATRKTTKRRTGTRCLGRGPSENLPVSTWQPPTSVPTGPTFVDMLCGAGGSSLGLTRAGMRLVLGMNHWQVAIDTHAANFTYADHLVEDVTIFPKHALPRADILWASPICTEMSPAGGKARNTRNEVYIDPKKPAGKGQGSLLDELGYVPAEGKEATRATHWSVVEMTTIHRFKYVITENVADCAEDWELFDIWIQAMCRLGYRVQILSMNSALVSGDEFQAAPQWRDRIYCVFTRVDMPDPELDLRPRSFCVSCNKDVEGVQTWAKSTVKRVAGGAGARRLFLVGRYRRIPGSSYGQYWYTCPNGCQDEKRNPMRVEPYIRPASSIIDWSDLGGLIGDRTGNEVLSDNTITRIKTGLRRFGRPVVVNTNHDDDRIRDPFRVPLDGRTTKIGDGLACPPMMVPCGGTWADDAMSVEGPARTQLANEKGCEALVVPPQPWITVLRGNESAESLADPFSTVACGNHQYLTTPPGVPMRRNAHGILVPYYTNGDPSTTETPIGALSTHDRFALVTDPAGWLSDVSIEELVGMCNYRMLKPRESLRAQEFPDEYVVVGGVGEQTAQAGNAVSANCAEFIGRAVIKAMSRTAAVPA